MKARDFVQRVYQVQHRLMCETGGTDLKDWQVRIHPLDWWEVTTDDDLFTQKLPVCPDPGEEKVLGLPIVIDTYLDRGAIRLRIEVAA